MHKFRMRNADTNVRMTLHNVSIPNSSTNLNPKLNPNLHQVSAVSIPLITFRISAHYHTQLVGRQVTTGGLDDLHIS